jgi:citrate lyase beta subunit
MNDNPAMRILQFASMQQAEVMARLIRASRRSPATVVVDLEDGLWDVIDEAETSALKAVGRENLVTLAQTHPELFARHPIGVRINRSTGPHVELDLDALALASRFVEFECVVPTKIETGAELREIAANLRGRGVAFRTIVPIVETRHGLANLERILDAARDVGTEWLAYGHFDFALDSGWWPFPEPGEARFWEQVVPLVHRLERAGLGYVHPPYFQTHDRVGMASIIRRLERTCSREFGIITLGPRQTEMADRLSSRDGPADEAVNAAPPMALRTASGESPSDLARRVVTAFLATRRHPGGFALDPRSGEFISPHVYLAARGYLRRVGDD